MSKRVLVILRASLLCVLWMMATPHDAQAQSKTLVRQFEATSAARLTLSVSPKPDDQRFYTSRVHDGASSPARQPSPPACRRERRTMIGTLIGAAAAAPLAVLAHRRFENEARSGTAAAAYTVAAGAAVGALIGLATCN